MPDQDWGEDKDGGWAKQDPKAFDREPPKPKPVPKVIPLTPEQRAFKRGEKPPAPPPIQAPAANAGVGSSGSAGANTGGGGGGGGNASSSAGVSLEDLGPRVVEAWMQVYRASPQTGIGIWWALGPGPDAY